MPLTGGATEAHGAFTAALIETLQAMPADTPATLIYERVKAVLEGSSVPDQDPDLDALEARRQQPLFGGTAAKSSKVRAAALGTTDDGNVLLDIGSVAGVGVGTEFTSENPGRDGKQVLLRITDLSGIARSTASVSPAGAKVREARGPPRCWPAVLRSGRHAGPHRRRGVGWRRTPGLGGCYRYNRQLGERSP